MKILLAGLLAFYSSLADAGDLFIRDAYIPPLPPVGKVYAAYMIISNKSERARTLVGVRAAAFTMAHVHESKIIDGVASMQSVKALEVPAGKSIAMMPGRIHVMLIKPTVDIAAHDTVILELMFADGEVVSVNAELGKIN